MPAVPKRQFSGIVTIQQFQALWKVRKERTSSSPHNVHFGHYKVIAEHQQLSNLVCKILSIALCTGYAPSQYKKMMACLLEKKPGERKIGKLRIILLLDALYSTSLMLMARWISNQAELNGSFAPEQFGSRKGLDARTQATNIKLVMDHSRRLRRPLAVVANDLKSCYDRAAHDVVGMCMAREGMSKAAIEMRFGVAQDPEINVRTGHGDSEITNKSGIWKEPHFRTLHSVFQGSGDGPVSWALVSSAILRPFRLRGYGTTIRIRGNHTKKVPAALFVDDSTYFQDAEPLSPSSLVPMTQEAQTYLQGLIRAPGGALNPDKSFWWLMKYRWTQNPKA